MIYFLAVVRPTEYMHQRFFCLALQTLHWDDDTNCSFTDIKPPWTKNNNNRPCLQLEVSFFYNGGLWGKCFLGRQGFFFATGSKAERRPRIQLSSSHTSMVWRLWTVAHFARLIIQSWRSLFTSCFQQRVNIVFVLFLKSRGCYCNHDHYRPLTFQKVIILTQTNLNP